jgi:hypothetical protein
VLEAGLDTLDVVVIAGEALGIGAVVDVTIGVLWATEAADDAFDALEAPEATGAADNALVAGRAVDDDAGLLEATGDADVATGMLEAIGLLAVVRATEVDNELLGITGATDEAVELLEAIGTVTDADELLGARGAVYMPIDVLVTTKATDEAFDALEDTGVTETAIRLVEETGEEEETIGLLGVTTATGVTIELLEATGTMADAIGLLETEGIADVAVRLLEVTGTVGKADELLKMTGVATGVDELLAITGAVEIVVTILEATGAVEEAIELLETNGRVTDVDGIFEAMEAACVAIGLLETIGVADDDTEETGAADDDSELLGTIGATDIPVVLLDSTTTLEVGRSELDTETIWLTETDWDSIIVVLVTVIAGVLWGTIEVAVVMLTTTALDVVGVAEETAWLDELTTAVTVFRDITLKDVTIEGIALETEFAILGSVTLDAEVEMTWLDALLAGPWEVTDNVEGLDAGITLVAPTITAILVVGVDRAIGTELDKLLTMVAMLDDDTTWLIGLLFTWAADVARLELVEALWTDELGTTAAILVTVDSGGIIWEPKLLLIGVTTLVTVLLNTNEVVWLQTLLDWARTGDTLPRLVLSWTAWVVLAMLDASWDVDTITVIPELPTTEPTTVVAEFAALAETWVDATEPAPTSAKLLPPAVWMIRTLVSPTPTLTR